MEIDNIVKPVLYLEIWLAIALVAVTVIVIYVIIVLTATAKRKPRTEPAVDATSFGYREQIRHKHMDAVQNLTRQAESGELSTSDLNQKLGVILRAFAAEYSGLNTKPMTLSELKRSQVPRELVAAIEQFYPIAFRNLAEKSDPAVSEKAALDVIDRWI